MINEVVVIGNLTKDPFYKESEEKKFAGITLAVNGIKKEDVSYLNVCIFGNMAKPVKDYCKKGSKVCVVGYLHTRKSGDLFVTEIIANKVEFLDSKKPEETKEQQEVPFDFPNG